MLLDSFAILMRIFLCYSFLFRTFLELTICTIDVAIMPESNSIRTLRILAKDSESLSAMSGLRTLHEVMISKD